MPLARRLPKRGFKNYTRKEYLPVNLARLEKDFENGAEVNLEVLREKRIVTGPPTQIKVLGKGEITKALKVTAHAFSASAREKIEAAGGSCELIAQA